MHPRLPALFAALVSLLTPPINASPAPTEIRATDDCHGATPHVSLMVPEWGQVVSLDKNDVDFYQIWGPSGREFAFNEDDQYTVEHFYYYVYEARGVWPGKYAEGLKISKSYECTITAPHGMQGQCFGIPLNVGDSAIATGRNTAVDTHCQQTFPK